MESIGKKFSEGECHVLCFLEGSGRQIVGESGQAGALPFLQQRDSA